MPTLVLLSMKRSGTNWFMDLANRLPGCLALRETFNPGGVFGIEKRDGAVRKALARHLGLPDVGERTPEAVALARSDPIAFLDLAGAAAREAGYPWLGVTIFNEQLSDAVLTTVLCRADTWPIVLVRQQLPRFVSLVKAQNLDAWKTVDTTDLRPAIDVAAFAAEAAAARAWFGLLRRLLPGEVPVLTYEDHVLPGPEACIAALRTALPALLQEHVGPPPKPWIQRQDRNDDVFDAVADGVGLRRALTEAGLLAEAFAHPWGERGRAPAAARDGAGRE